MDTGTKTHTLNGKKIPYLDLSIMWNAWLDLEVTEQDYAQETIEGGTQRYRRIYSPIHPKL